LNKITERTSSIISVLLHPLFMPLYATFIIFNSGTYLAFATGERLQKFIYIVIFVSTYLLPSMTAYFMWKRGWIDSLEMESRQERNFPFIATLLCYAAGMYLLWKLPVPRLFGILVGGGALAILWAFLVNLRWKISIHMVGIGGLMGLLFAYAFYFHADVQKALVVLAILSGILGTARLIRKSHVPSQVYIGFLGGFLLEFFYFRMVVGVMV
jgi:uncharacterized membrane protein